MLRRHLADAASSFAIGVPAAVAEFMRRDVEDFDLEDDGLCVTTPRGAIRIAWRDDVRPIAYEALSRRPARWLHGVVFCLPEAAARMGGRQVLSELGPDTGAVQAEHRDSLLFDLGVAAPQVDFCIRTAEPSLIERLRVHCGQAMADWPAELSRALMAANPQRVVASPLGRIEVTGPIPRERTPLGPHTHLFPERLADGRTHNPETPVPTGWLACLQLYPPNAVIDMEGETTPFDTARHDAFQDLLEVWGDPDYLAAKARALAGEAGMADQHGPAGLAAEVARRQASALDGQRGGRPVGGSGG